MPLPPGPGMPQDGAGDPSMDDILASIRRILNEDEALPAPPTPASATGGGRSRLQPRGPALTSR